MSERVHELREKVRATRARLDSLAERTAQLRSRLDGGAGLVAGASGAPESPPTLELRVEEPSREDGLFLGDDPWEIVLASEEGK